MGPPFLVRPPTRWTLMCLLPSMLLVTTSLDLPKVYFLSPSDRYLSHSSVGVTDTGTGMVRRTLERDLCQL